MKDIQIDENFEVVIDDRNDLGIVDDLTEFEQSLRVWLTAYLHDNVGNLGGPDTLPRIRLQVERIARDNDRLNQIEDIHVQFSDTTMNSVEVEIAYTAGEISTFEMIG